MVEAALFKMALILLEAIIMSTFEDLVTATKEYVAKDHADRALEALMDGMTYAYGAKVEGDIAEFGTMTGRSAVILATGLAFNNARYKKKSGGIASKNLLLFDSFEGLPSVADHPVDSQSLHFTSGSWGPGTCSGLSAGQLGELVKQILSPSDQFQIVEGWFDEVLVDYPARKLSMVHIDCDLYSSAKTVLQQLFTKQMISEGCAIFFDDFFCDRARPFRGEQLAWKEVIAEFNVEATPFRSYGALSQAFIVHNYSGGPTFPG